MVSIKNSLLVLSIILAIVGAFDAGYLAWEHYQNTIPPCTVGIFSDCGQVLTSKYAIFFGIPLALIGLVHYLLEATALAIIYVTKKSKFKILAVLLSAVGFVSSLYFMFLMFVVLKAICIYCLGSALISIIIFLIVPNIFLRERKLIVLQTFFYGYKFLMKPILFLFNPEVVHVNMSLTGEVLGEFWLTKKFMHYLIHYQHPNLQQQIAGINFSSPVGLAAGFDYHAQLTQILPEIGFGFGSLGTITNLSYEGNPRPMLGRLPKSKSLMVNKGFKNLGAKNTILKLQNLKYSYPVGVSIGRTNSDALATQSKSIKDIVHTFKSFEESKVKHQYYELNISCPNLKGDVSFYPPNNLDELLSAVDRIELTRPVFIKMPIEESDANTLLMLKVIARHKVAGVIFGNLTKNRQNKSLDPHEVAKFPVGNFSGKPCFDRSNELISLCYKNFGRKLIIIGCGGVFNTNDALEKIRRGATLVQLITGMIYEGPQLISQINMGISDYLVNNNLKKISEIK